jgi:hypothetical protein
MKKLSELDMDTMLTVQHQSDGDFSIMTKRDYLDSAEYLDFPVEPLTAVTVAEKTIANFDLYSMLEWIGEDECYEDWAEDVWNTLKGVVEYYDAREGGAWEMMFGDNTEEDLLADRVEVMRCLAALSEAMVS